MDDRSPGLGYPYKLSFYDVNADIAKGLSGLCLNFVVRMCSGKILRQADMGQIFLVGIGNICFIKSIC